MTIATLIVLGPLIAFWLLFQQILRWKIYVFGRNARAEDGKYRYIFAIQNGEDVELEVPFRLEIQIEQEPHEIEEGPHLFCGPSYKVQHQHLSDDKRTYWVDSNGLPPLDTWVVRFATRADPRNVSFRFLRPPHPEEDGSRSRWPRYIKPIELHQAPGDESSLPDKTPSWWVWCWALCVAFGLYLVPVLLHDHPWLPYSNLFTPLGRADAIILPLLCILSYFVFRVSRLDPYPVIQGYLDIHEPPKTPSVEPSQPESGRPPATG